MTTYNIFKNIITYIYIFYIYIYLLMLNKKIKKFLLSNTYIYINYVSYFYIFIR